MCGWAESVNENDKKMTKLGNEMFNYGGVKKMKSICVGGESLRVWKRISLHVIKKMKEPETEMWNSGREGRGNR